MDSLSTKINYLFVPSLKHLAFINIASRLWSQNDVKDLFSEKISYDDGISKDDWLVVENAVIKKVPELHLPRKLGNVLISYIHPVGSKIIDWINYHVLHHRYVTLTEVPNEFFWTPQGNIDNQKVAEILVNDVRLDIYARFKLACVYCLEEYIKLLFNELPKGFYKQQSAEAIVRVWSDHLASELNRNANLTYQERNVDFKFVYKGFKISVSTGNEAGTKYFLHRFTPQDRYNYLIRSTCAICCNRTSKLPAKKRFPNCHYANNLCYLLSQMNDDQQTKLFTYHPSDVLHYLLNWPWQNYFLRTAIEIGQSLDLDDYYYLLQAIIVKISSEAKDFNYKDLLREFWQLSPYAYKRHVILMHEGLETLLPSLLVVGDKEITKLILEAAKVTEKEKFIFCPIGQFICRFLIKAGNWNLLKFLIQECTLSKEKLERIFFLISCYVTRMEDCDILNEVYHSLCDIKQGNKRKYIEDEDNNLTIKLCCSG